MITNDFFRLRNHVPRFQTFQNPGRCSAGGKRSKRPPREGIRGNYNRISGLHIFFSIWLWYRAAQTATWASAADFEKLNFLAGVNRLSQVLVSKPLLFCLSVHSSSSSSPFSSSSSCGSSFTSPSTEHALLWRSTRAPASNPPGLLFSPLRTFTFARKSASPVSDLLSCFLFNASP